MLKPLWMLPISCQTFRYIHTIITYNNPVTKQTIYYLDERMYEYEWILTLNCGKQSYILFVFLCGWQHRLVWAAPLDCVQNFRTGSLATKWRLFLWFFFIRVYLAYQGSGCPSYRNSENFLYTGKIGNFVPKLGNTEKEGDESCDSVADNCKL